MTINAVFGQIKNIRFRQISPPGGFTLDGIKSIVQDDLGYIWMGTSEGLIRYDSKNTKWYYASNTDSLSLPNPIINNVFCDSENQIWISTNQGMCTFNHDTEAFKRIKYSYEDGSRRANIVYAALRTAENKLLVIDEYYFGILDLQTQQLYRIGKDQLTYPTKMYKDNSNRIWIGTLNGDVFQYLPSKNTVKKIVSNQRKVNSIYSENNQIWVGTEGEGAKVYSLNGAFLKQVSFNGNSSNSSLEHVRVINKDTYGRFWYGTYEGLFMDDGNKITRFRPRDYPGLPHNSIYEIFEDNQGALWFATWSGGVALIHHSDNNFKTYRNSTLRNSISHNRVTSFLQIDEKEMLLGTEVGGLNSFNLNTEKFNTIQLSEDDPITNIKSLCKDKEGGIWIGTFRKGLWYKPKGTSTFRLIEEGPEDGKHISSSSVYSLYAVDSGVWIGTFARGVNFYSFKSKSMRHCFLNNTSGIPTNNIPVQTMLIDSKSNLWLGALFGGFLYKVHLPSGSITHFRSENVVTKNASIDIYHLWEHSSGDIWIGTKNEGLLIYNPDADTFTSFDADGILKNKNVYGILEDKNKQIWITSSSGLILFNPEDKSIRHFVYSDGIQSNMFCPQAVYEDDRKNLYFGGTNGFTTIDPDDLKTNTKKPYTIINSVVTKNNKSIFLNYSEKFEIEPIQLNPEETTFRITFSADNYLLPEKNNYKYRLINYYDDWIDVRNEGSVLFTNMDAGEYYFEVKACNNDGFWNDSPTQMKIVVNEFWYSTTLAYIIYITLTIIIFSFIARFYYERIKLKRAVVLEKNQRENEEQLHEMKLKFFTNISHEFRTPLTLISWPLKKLINAENITEEQQQELEVVTRNSNRLLQLINQVIDLRKLEKGKSKLNLSKIEIVSFVQELLKGFSSESKIKEYSVILDTTLSDYKIEADREKLDTILFNLISNAYKYTPRKGQITISINNKRSLKTQGYNNQLSFGQIDCDDFVEISVENSGQGINSEDLVMIFNRFEQGKQREQNAGELNRGSGIGLSLCQEFTLLHGGEIIAQSAEGLGSRFTIILPAKQKAQSILFENHHDVGNPKSIEELPIKTKVEHEPENVKQILIVEDNDDMRGFIRNFLCQYYNVESAVNGEEALGLLKKRSIDLVVSDVMMPKMDGFELCSLIKTQIETSHIPVVLLTALSSSDNLIAGLDKGADAYIAKPFDETVLLKQIENLLAQRTRIHNNFTKQFGSQKIMEVGSLDNFFLNRVKTVVEKNLSNENFGMDILAEELLISRSQLHRKIKSLSGFTTSDFVNLIRIKKAVELIEKENYRFSEVAFHVGFSSQSYFNKCFRKVYNKTPKDYFSKHT